MLDANTLRTVFAEKLLATHSMDDALLKVIWVAYKAGLADGAAPPITYDFGDNRCPTSSSATTVDGTEISASNPLESTRPRVRVVSRAPTPPQHIKKNLENIRSGSSSIPLKDLLTEHYKSRG